MRDVTHSERGAGNRPSRRFSAAAILLLMALAIPVASTKAADPQLASAAIGAAVERTVSATLAASMYGTGIAADTKANMAIGYYFPKVAHGFKAPTSSGLQAIRFSQRGGSDYSRGTGGTMKISVQTDNAGKPSGTVLSYLTFKPGNKAGSWTRFDRYYFSKPATLTAGRKYYIVFENIDPSPRSNHISINNIAVLKGVTSPRQPAFGDADFGVHSTARGSWAVEPAYTAVMDLTFVNGKHAGQGYIEAMVAKYGLVTGTTKRVRERFTVSGTNRFVTMAAVRVKQIYGGSPLMVTLETSTGKRIESVAVPASLVPVSGAGAIGGEVWVTARFLHPHTLYRGASYNLRLSTASGTAYTTVPIREGTDAGLVSRRFTDGHGQRTIDGVHWSNLYQYSPTDLQFYLR